MFDWYINLMNFLDKRAKGNHLLSRMEVIQLNNCIKRYTATDANEVIHDIADANDCGICNSWNDLVVSLHQLFVSGERIQIERR